MEEDERTWLTTREAAARLGISQTSVLQAIRGGKLAAKTLGPRLKIIEIAAIEQYEREHLGRKGWAKRRRSKAST
ncbi:MAG TPA: helix-turn-helix domain-containing protein [Chloroflexota bacterium]|nr:helix-turn-helix domain-containing protein [Chloroflexota bacterium]